MFNSPARTLVAPVAVSGRGLHTGDPVKVHLRPAEPGAGLQFHLQGVVVRVGLHTATAGPGYSAVGPVRTVEHLLAGCLLTGVTDLQVHLDAPELPGLDGSALPWLEALENTVETGSTLGWTARASRVEQAGGVATVTPAASLEVRVELDFGGPYRATLDWDGTSACAAARTFARHRDLPALADRGHGLDEVLILGPRGPLVPARSPDEWAQHKLLDLLGDLMLAGAPVRGSFRVQRGSHRLHLAMLRACAPPPSRSD